MMSPRETPPQLWLRVLSPEGLLYEGAVWRVTLPGTRGRFTVLPQHAPLLSSLVRGQLTFVPDAVEEQHVALKEGFVEVCENRVTVCMEQE